MRILTAERFIRLKGPVLYRKIRVPGPDTPREVAAGPLEVRGDNDNIATLQWQSTDVSDLESIDCIHRYLSNRPLNKNLKIRVFENSAISDGANTLYLVYNKREVGLIKANIDRVYESMK